MIDDAGRRIRDRGVRDMRAVFAQTGEEFSGILGKSRRIRGGGREESAETTSMSSGSDVGAGEWTATRSSLS